MYEIVVSLLMMVVSGEAQSKPVLVNCGANSSVIVDGRRWIGDLAPNDNFTVSSPGVAAKYSTADGNSTLGPLYKTARIFNALNYTFAGMQGNYFLRLHFCPFPFENYNVNESSFSVVANGLKLMTAFNVPVEISDKNLHLQNSNSNSRDRSGFINAIEVVPVVGTLFADSGGKNRAYHQDYFDTVSSKTNTLWVQLGPDTAVGASGTDALLNGLEIFKLSRSANLAFADRIDSTEKSASHSKSWTLWLGVGAGVASVLIIANYIFLHLLLRQESKKTNE
ncbi:hypothetical protein NC652_028646 [Populus alba x Populus x berolinensis]|nr:hypothetical protein NC652_028646 [Populus alba x Populus x berolinensis]